VSILSDGHGNLALHPLELGDQILHRGPASAEAISVTRGHSDLGENAEMKKWIVTGLAPAALAAEKFFIIVDTVGNCFVVHAEHRT
jgi:hypothetical protein